MSADSIRILPDEIIVDIVSRLPVKSVGRFRCVSKPWRSMLSDPQFINTHLTHRHSSNLQQNLILTSPSCSVEVITDIGNNAVSRKLTFRPELTDSWIEVVDSCNGLVLLANEEYDKFLVNPTILRQVKVPDSPLALKKSESFCMHGFGYDSFGDDYKIVTLSYYDTDNEHEPDCADTFVDVYSVKQGVWRRLASSPYDHAVPELSSGAFVNGSIHWLASSRKSGYPSVIAAFDLANESFKEIPAPSSLDSQKFVFNKLVALEGFLCMIDSHFTAQIDVWIMGEYGLGKSWKKITIFHNSDWDIVKPLCFIGDEEIVLGIDAEKLVVYDVKMGTLRDLVVDGVPATSIDGLAFMESLVSPSFSNEMGRKQLIPGESAE